MIILFDLDGTLIDSTEAILASFHNSFKVHNHKVPKDEEITKLIGYPLDVMYKSLGVQDEMIEKFVSTYKEHYCVVFTHKTILLENARVAIEKASKFATLGIVTTKTGLYSKLLMEHFDLMDYFEVLIGREHVNNPKPHAEPILRAIESLDDLGKEIWMIGDTKLDLISSKNAGVNSIAVLSGYDNAETLKKFSDVVLKDALEAIDFLECRKKSHI